MSDVTGIAASEPIEPPRSDSADDSASRSRFVRHLLVWLAIGSVLISLGSSWLSGGIVFDLLRPDLAAVDKVDRLRQFFERFGVLAPLVYFAFVTIEVVVAPLPGLMLYAPGGVLFGGLLGGAIALAGNVAGAGIACALMRGLGGAWLAKLIPSDSLEPVQQMLERRGGWLIFLLRLNPLTSSDLVSYAAGLTRLPVWKVMTATLAGMAPLCFAQAFLAENVLTAIPQLLYPLLAACVVYAVCVCVVVRRLALTGGSLADQTAER
ncbi:hypothetical protein GC176_08015 [bacterium]|nr:hypothetical protein [bacterium]